VNATKTRQPTAARREAKSRAALVAAYREGLGLTAVAVVRNSVGVRIAVDKNGDDDLLAAADLVQARWWCRRAADAERVAAAATARLRPHESCDAPDSILSAGEAIAAAAKRLNVALHADDDVLLEATEIIARVDQELATLQRAGELKSINRAYRTYRTEASARGERVAPYAEWLNKYKANLVCQLAATLRFS